MLIVKYQRRFPGFDEKIVSMYARGMSVRDPVPSAGDLRIDVSPDLSADHGRGAGADWRMAEPASAGRCHRFFDCLRVRIRDDGTVRNKAMYIDLGVRPDGTKAVPGLWIEQTPGAKFCLHFRMRR